MAKLSREDVLRLARLARLTLTDEEVDEFRNELESILEYVTMLQDADVAGLQPTTQVTGAKNVMRADEVQDYGVSRDQLLHLLPQRQDDEVKVQRMIG